MSSSQKYTASGLVKTIIHARPTAEGKRAVILNKHEDNNLNREIKALERRHNEKMHFLNTRREHFEREHEEHFLPPLVCVSSHLSRRNQGRVKPKITRNGIDISRLHDIRNASSLPDLVQSARNQKEKKEEETNVGRLRARSCESLKTAQPAKEGFFISDLFHLSPPHWDYERMTGTQENNNNTLYKRHKQLEPICTERKPQVNITTRPRSLSHAGITSLESIHAIKTRSLSAEIPRRSPTDSPIRQRKKSL